MTEAKCPICKGKKKVKSTKPGEENVRIICPHCKGRGKIVGP